LRSNSTTFVRSTKVVELLLKSGADVDVTNAYGQTPLHAACSHGNIDTVQALLGSGALVSVTDMYRNTPLHVASKHGHTDVVQAFLASGARVNCRGVSPLALVMLTRAPLARNA
jgi:ankyrin repeat protein